MNGNATKEHRGLRKGQIAFDYISGKLKNQDNYGDISVLVKTLGRNAHRAFGPAELDIAVAALHAASGGRPLTAIQAGANDGIDPVYKLFHRYFGKIVLVEPQVELISALRNNYADYKGSLIIENLAVGPTGTEIVLHIPDLYMQDLYIERVGRSVSFVVGTDRALTSKILQGRCGISAEEADAHLVATRIPAIGVADLAKRHGIEHLDMLQVDCEGYDWEVIATLGDLRPTIINFESKLLSDNAWQSWQKFAAENDYGYIVCNSDTLAIRNAKFG